MLKAIWPKAKTPRIPRTAGENPAFRNRIVGVVRFSFPSLSGFSKIPQEAASAKAILYDTDRLERRFKLFEALTLPSMLAQTDTDFQLGFVIGDDFPARFLDRLKGLLQDLPQAYLVAQEPKPNFAATNFAFKAADLSGGTHMASFRLDDDDALDMDFIARLRRQADTLFPLCGDTPFAISQNRGFYMETGETGGDIYDVQERTPLGIGVALVSRIRSGHTIFIKNHRDLAEVYNAYADAVTPAFIRSVHRDNDANPHVAGSKRNLAQDEVHALIERHFPFKIADLKTL